MLMQQQLIQFKTFGFIILRQVFSPGEMAEIADEAHSLWREDAHESSDRDGHQSVAPFVEKRLLLAWAPLPSSRRRTVSVKSRESGGRLGQGC